MELQGQLVKINNQPVHRLKSYKIEQGKIWSDAGRNMAGNLVASLIGVFPKITLEFPDGMTQSEVATIARILNSASFSVEYYDPIENRRITGEFYSNDFTIELMSRKNIYKAWSVALIPLSKKGA